jgi:hypothetical protein
MDVIKSVRIRKRVPTTEESTGTSDIKVTLYEKGRKKRIVKGFSLDSNSEEVAEIWKELRYDGERYENLTDNQIIDDFIRVKTLAERPQGDKIKIGFPPKDETFYQILQDPFDKKIPVERSFGFDPYYLNNGAELYIKWFKANVTEIQWTFSNATPTGSMSMTGSVVIKIETNELDRQPLFFTYSAANNPIQNGLTPSYFDIQMYWESVTSGGITQLAGLSANGVQYMLPGKKFVNPEDLIPQGGKQYSKSIYDGGKIYTTEDLKKVPPDIVRRIEVYPPKDSEGKFVEKPWAIEKYTNDSMTDVRLSYISDISTRTDLDYKYFKDDLALNRLQYNLTTGTQSYLRDYDLIGDILSYWKKKVPNYGNLDVCAPDNLSCSVTKYISPIDPVVEDIVELANNVTPGLSPSIPGQTPSLPAKQKLNFVFPENFEIIERVTVPEFKIFVGDPIIEEIDGEFIAEDFDVDVSELDDEYKEGIFAGAEELGLTPEEYAYQEGISLGQEDSSKPVTPEQAGPDSGKPVEIKPVSSFDALINLAGKCARELGKDSRVNAANMKIGYKKGVHGLCPQGTQAVLYALTGIKAVGQIRGNADWFSFGPTNPGGGAASFSKTGYFKDKVKVQKGSGKVWWKGTYIDPANKKDWQVGDVIAMAYSGKSYGHIQVWTGYSWMSDFKQGDSIQKNNVNPDSVALWRLNEKGIEAVKKQTSSN